MNGDWTVPVGQSGGASGLRGVVPTKMTSTGTRGTSQATFQEVLQSANASSPVKLSSHAQARLSERGIVLSQADWSRVQSAVDQASQRGVRDAYLMMGQVGLVVNVPNRTVITALEHGPKTIVTNIDSVVVV